MKKIRLETDQNHPAIREYVEAIKRGDANIERIKKELKKTKKYKTREELIDAVFDRVMKEHREVLEKLAGE